MPTQTINPTPFRVLLRRRNAGAPTATLAAAAITATPTQPASDPATRTASIVAAATVQQLEAAFPGDGGFVLACLRERWTLTQANAAYIAALKDRNAKLRAQADSTKPVTDGGSAITKAIGDHDRASGSEVLPDLSISNHAGASSMATATAVKSVADQNRERQLAAGIKRAGDKFGHLNEVVIEYQRRGLSRAAATRQAVIDHPALHTKWLADKRESHQRGLTRAQHRVGFK